MKNSFILSPFYLDEPTPGLESLAGSDWIINKPDLPINDKQSRMSAIHQPLSHLVSEIVADGARPVSIAGDCCAAIPVLAGLQRSGTYPALIWFDAHGDFNTWDTTPSGYIGGMPLAMIVGKGEQTMPDAVGLTPLSEKQVILADARELDPGERNLLEESEVSHFENVEEILKSRLLEELIYLHFDTDVISPEEVAAQNYSAKGGPSGQIIRSVFNELAQSHKVVAVSVSSWNPKLDEGKESEKVCMSLLKALVS